MCARVCAWVAFAGNSILCRLALAERAIDPASFTAVRLGSGAAVASHQFDIATFVRKMERLYDILVQSSRATRRDIVGTTDLSFLTGDASS